MRYSALILLAVVFCYALDSFVRPWTVLPLPVHPDILGSRGGGVAGYAVGRLGPDILLSGRGPDILLAGWRHDILLAGWRHDILLAGWDQTWSISCYYSTSFTK
jgi:hypothetical protein